MVSNEAPRRLATSCNFSCRQSLACSHTWLGTHRVCLTQRAHLPSVCPAQCGQLLLPAYHVLGSVLGALPSQCLLLGGTSLMGSRHRPCQRAGLLSEPPTSALLPPVSPKHCWHGLNCPHFPVSSSHSGAMITVTALSAQRVHFSRDEPPLSQMILIVRKNGTTLGSYSPLKLSERRGWVLQVPLPSLLIRSHLREGACLRVPFLLSPHSLRNCSPPF